MFGKQKKITNSSNNKKNKTNNNLTNKDIFNSKKQDTYYIDKSMIEETKEEEDKWIEVYAYKGLSNNMISNVFHENVVPYELNKTYIYNREGIKYSDWKGFYVWKNLYDTFERYDPLEHCKYYRVKAIVKEKQWKYASTSVSIHEIVAKEITLVEEIKIDFKTLIDGFEYLGYSTQYRINTIFNTEDKWLDYYCNKKLKFHDFVYAENLNRLKEQCKISDSLAQIILNKINNKAIKTSKTIINLEEYIDVYLYVKKIIDLITIDKISKEKVLTLLCNNTLF